MLRSSVEAAKAFSGEVVGVVGDVEIGVFSPRPATRDVRGEIAAMALYAGCSVDHVTQTQPAAEIIAELTAAL